MGTGLPTQRPTKIELHDHLIVRASQPDDVYECIREWSSMGHCERLARTKISWACSSQNQYFSLLGLELDILHKGTIYLARC